MCTREIATCMHERQTLTARERENFTATGPPQTWHPPATSISALLAPLSAFSMSLTSRMEGAWQGATGERAPVFQGARTSFEICPEPRSATYSSPSAPSPKEEMLAPRAMIVGVKGPDAGTDQMVPEPKSP